MELPKFPEQLSEGLLDERYCLSITKSLLAEIEAAKTKYGARALNAWLRSMWKYGLNESAPMPAVAPKSSLVADLDYD